MNYVRVLCVGVLAVVVLSAASAQVDYATKIQPVFDSHCIGCHGTVRSGVTLSSYAAVMASVGTQYASKVVVPGSSATSPLYDKISNATPLKGLRMPRNSTPLTDADILLIKNWIDQGAAANSPTGVAQRIPGSPDTYALSQNYPNPFNPSTRIRFSVTEHRFVTLKIFDVVGREVASLVNGTLEPGTYSVEWNAAGAGSGMYFYQLRTADASGVSRNVFVDTKKLIVQK